MYFMSCAAKRNDVDAKLVQACSAFVPAPDTTHFPVVALFVTLSAFCISSILSCLVLNKLTSAKRKKAETKRHKTGIQHTGTSPSHRHILRAFTQLPACSHCKNNRTTHYSHHADEQKRPHDRTGIVAVQLHLPQQVHARLQFLGVPTSQVQQTLRIFTRFLSSFRRVSETLKCLADGSASE